VQRLAIDAGTIGEYCTRSLAHRGNRSVQRSSITSVVGVRRPGRCRIIKGAGKVDNLPSCHLTGQIG